MKNLILTVILVFYSIYHVHIGRRLKRIFCLNSYGVVGVAIPLLILHASILLSRWLSNSGWLLAGQFFFRMGALWIGFLFPFFCFEKTVDVDQESQCHVEVEKVFLLLPGPPCLLSGCSLEPSWEDKG
ncbi:MAG: hypothetical protein HQL73_14205 [Magnetococcales bacterium]|nr:hypothetical protein [Magnetococcales bacterium]